MPRLAFKITDAELLRLIPDCMGVQKVQQVVAGLHLPSGIRVTYGGKYAQQQKDFHDMAVVLVLAIVLVFTVLLFEFRYFSAPVAILSSALLSISGVFMALLITGKTVNLASLIDRALFTHTRSK